VYSASREADLAVGINQCTVSALASSRKLNDFERSGLGKHEGKL
jgi:hypothetical protein